MANIAGFDDPGVFFADNFAFGDFAANDAFLNENSGVITLNKLDLKRRAMEFIRSFQSDNIFIYRDALKRNYFRQMYTLEICLDDLLAFDRDLFDKVKSHPNELLPVIEEACRDMVFEVLRSGNQDDQNDEEMQTENQEIPEKPHDIQVTISWKSNSCKLRQLTADKVATIVKVAGIVVASSSVRCKAVRMTLQCRNCKCTLPNLNVNPGLEGFALPRKCTSDQTGQVKCPLDPYYVIPDKCECVDFQQVKLQELPENVPIGEMPRHLLMYLERHLVDKVVPGNRVSAIGIFSIRKINSEVHKTAKLKSNVGTRSPYLRVLGVSVSDVDLTSEVGGRLISLDHFSPADIDEFKQISSGKNVYERISKSLAPSIFGMDDIKKAIACLLFGGSRKRLPDGLFRRGDINILLLGDPGTAKSQLLKFVEKVSPIAVYTTGKGCSAAGLTASIIRDPQSGQFVVEGGAMVLADGGVVCIDEFDKMKEDDRVAIHEAMEQQTISIAKAGITSTLNTRCSVLAAANSVFGKWDDLKGDSNIDFMPTILSRFDMIFILKDEFDQNRDTNLAKHVIQVHINAPRRNTREMERSEASIGTELSIATLKKYIAYCRSNIFPRLTPQACERLKNQYVLMRSGAYNFEQEIGRRLSVTITVRQLEAMVRIAESLARMRMSSIATDADVNEALRLFIGSTYTAAVSGKIANVEGMISHEELRGLNEIETHIKKRLIVGSQVLESHVIKDMMNRGYKERLVNKVLHTMIRRGELQHRIQRKMLFRVM
ncbi:hypothetical protein GJ496_008685 [Pomphorhynchus laevis]|nr:hypothetical protein GJ496_008685 [Pomphorhynchus laevis]